MEKDSIKRILKAPTRIFPTIGLFWILGQTNTTFDLLTLILFFLFIYFFDSEISFLANKVREKEKNPDLKKVLLIVNNQVMKNLKVYLLFLLILLLMNTYTLLRLFGFWEMGIAKFLLLIGLGGLIQGALKYIKNFKEQYLTPHHSQ